MTLRVSRLRCPLEPGLRRKLSRGAADSSISSAASGSRSHEKTWVDAQLFPAASFACPAFPIDRRPKKRLRPLIRNVSDDNREQVTNPPFEPTRTSLKRLQKLSRERGSSGAMLYFVASTSTISTSLRLSTPFTTATSRGLVDPSALKPSTTCFLSLDHSLPLGHTISFGLIPLSLYIYIYIYKP